MKTNQPLPSAGLQPGTGEEQAALRAGAPEGEARRGERQGRETLSGGDGETNGTGRQATPADSGSPSLQVPPSPSLLATPSLQVSPSPSLPAPLSPAQRKRVVRRRRKLDVQRLHLGMAWILCGLICKRYKLPLPGVAAEAHVGKQTLREYLHLEHPEAWTTGSRLALEVGYFPDELEAVTRRWMRKYRRRMMRQHAGEPGYVMHYPWEQVSGQA